MNARDYHNSLADVRVKIAEIQAKIGYLQGQHVSVVEEIADLELDALQLKRILVAAQFAKDLEKIEREIEIRERKKH